MLHRRGGAFFLITAGVVAGDSARTPSWIEGPRTFFNTRGDRHVMAELSELALAAVCAANGYAAKATGFEATWAGGLVWQVEGAFDGRSQRIGSIPSRGT